METGDLRTIEAQKLPKIGNCNQFVGNSLAGLVWHLETTHDTERWRFWSGGDRRLIASFIFLIGMPGDSRKKNLQKKIYRKNL